MKMHTMSKDEWMGYQGAVEISPSQDPLIGDLVVEYNGIPMGAEVILSRDDDDRLLIGVSVENGDWWGMPVYNTKIAAAVLESLVDGVTTDTLKNEYGFQLFA
jgi:hypothetical protein